MTKEEWIDRYAEKVKERCEGIDESHARQLAEIGYDEMDCWD